MAIATEQPSNDVRLRQASSDRSPADDAASSLSRQRHISGEPPRFVVDLSLPPEERYFEVCAAFKSEMLGLMSLFDEVVGDMVHFVSLTWLRRICQLMLRGVCNKEENAELKGISKATGVNMYLLVCFNVLLDLFMGCSSGGAVVRAGTDSKSGSKMVHFRTLDWGMPALRRIIVHLDYVSEADGPVVASSITYAGFVGVLTGVRKDLSISLNFRPNRVDNGRFWADIQYGWHLLMVLLGWRPSISSTLRRFLLPNREVKRCVSWLPVLRSRKESFYKYTDVVKTIGGDKPLTTTACYLCMSNGIETTVIEKDRATATTRSNADFIVVTNTDEEPSGSQNTEVIDSPFATAFQEIVHEAKDRQECAWHNWFNLRRTKATRLELQNPSDADLKTLANVDDVVEMVQKYPTTNECTHFAFVMDPMEGRVSWCRRWMRPVTAKYIREHMSETW